MNKIRKVDRHKVKETQQQITCLVKWCLENRSGKKDKLQASLKESNIKKSTLYKEHIMNQCNTML